MDSRMAAQFLKDRETHARHKQGRCRGCFGERQAQVTDFLLLGLCDATFFTLCMGGKLPRFGCFAVDEPLSPIRPKSAVDILRQEVANPQLFKLIKPLSNQSRLLLVE